MTPPTPPRSFWRGITDEDLTKARDEYRSFDDPELQALATEMDDDLARRAAEAADRPPSRTHVPEDPDYELLVQIDREARGDRYMWREEYG